MIENVFVVGFHHQTLNSVERGEILQQKEVSLNEVDGETLANHGIKAATLLKTCNRIEMYGYGEQKGALDLFKQLTKVPDYLQSKHDLKYGPAALHHIFKVAAGLDSQLLGDQEIVSQFKLSFQKSKSYNLLDGFMERLANTSLQAAREIRKQTKLTVGTTSLSYSAIQILKLQKIPKTASILIVGLGKFGKSIAKNIKQYFPENQLTLSNRTHEKSVEIAADLECKSLSLDKVAENINEYDVLISAVEMNEYLLDVADYKSSTKQIIVDLSVPTAIQPGVQLLEGIQYYDVDEASQVVNETWKERQASVEPALEIIDEYMDSFIEWSKKYSQSSIIQKYKEKINVASEICPFFHHLKEDDKKSYLQRSIGLFVKHLKNGPEDVSEDQVIQEYLKIHA